MTVCDSPWIFVRFGLALLVLVSVPSFILARVALRRSPRWPMAAMLLLSLVGMLAFALFASYLYASVFAVPALIFLPAVLRSASALRRPSDMTLRKASRAAAVPLVLLAIATALLTAAAANTPPC